MRAFIFIFNSSQVNLLTTQADSYFAMCIKLLLKNLILFFFSSGILELNFKKILTDGKFSLKFPNTPYLKSELQISELINNPRVAGLHEESSVVLLHSCTCPQGIYSDPQFGLQHYIIKKHHSID